MVFSALFLRGHYFIQYGFIQVCTFYLFFWKTSFFCLPVLFVFSACFEFDVIFMNFCNICIIIIYILGVRYPVFVLTYHFSIKQFVRTDTGHKNLITAINKKNMPPGSFWFLQIPFIKKNVEHLQNESGKRYFEPLVLASL